MKNRIILGSTLCLLIATVILIACNKNNSISKDNLSVDKISSNNNPVLIANISNGEAIPVFSMEDYKDSLLNNGLFDNIEVAEINYGSSDNQEEAYLTIIGKLNNVSVSFQAELTIQGDGLYIEYPSENMQTMAKHTCTGVGCSSCDFTRGGFLNFKITGCICGSNSGGGDCNHTKSSDNSWLLTVASILLGFI